MFSPLRGPWPDMNWKGWWGDNPPYHVPVFILTHHARPPIEMEGGTTFHFVTGGIRDALERARQAAGEMDVRVGGGPNTIRQYLRGSLIDELHIAIAPVLLGGGERLFEGVDLRALGYECVEFAASEKATHVVLRHHGARGRLTTGYSRRRFAPLNIYHDERTNDELRLFHDPGHSFPARGGREAGSRDPAHVRKLTPIAHNETLRLSLYLCAECSQFWQTGHEWNFGDRDYVFRVPPIETADWLAEPYRQPAAMLLYSAEMARFHERNRFEPGDKPCREEGCATLAMKHGSFCVAHHVRQLQDVGILRPPPMGRLFPPYVDGEDA